MKRLILLGVMFAIEPVAFGWPTAGEIEKIKPVVEELMAAKTSDARPQDAAVVALELAGTAETEAAKFILLLRAVELYARVGDDANVESAFQCMIANVDGVPFEVQEKILRDAGRAISKANKKPVRTESLLRGVSGAVWAEKELKAARKELNWSKKNAPAAHLRAGNALVVLGDWPKALEHLCAADSKLAPVAEHEINGTASVDRLANAWWKAMALADVEYVKNAYRSHSAELYRKALDNNLLTGLNKSLAENRIAEVEKLKALSLENGNDQAGMAKTKASGMPSNDAETASEPKGKSGLYCVIDLSAGAKADKYPVSYMDASPEGGFNKDEYKTTKLVLRRITPGKFKMAGKYSVMLTKSYYIGIFEVTQKQFELVTGMQPSHWANSGLRPVEQVSYDMIRGTESGSKWPSSSAVDPLSFMGMLRMRTELNCDLPTSAQWEYACRAGTESLYNNGGNTIYDLMAVGRCRDNSNDSKGGNRIHHTHVGLYRPNAWGLYDMHGNVWEWCLDWSGHLSGGTDPKGPSKGTIRVIRGGSWFDGYAEKRCSSSGFSEYSPRSAADTLGFRLCVKLR